MYAIPHDGGMWEVVISDQDCNFTQASLAMVLGIPANQINVKMPRAGGGFGGKETQSNQFAVLCALAATRNNCAVKLRLDRDDDMICTGKRHDFLFDYEVGFNNSGEILALKIMMASRCGISPDLSGAINDRAIYHIDNAYFLPNIEINSYRCKTNTVSNTAFRGFGGPQGMFCIENIIENIAQKLKLEASEIRKINFYKDKIKNTTHYGMKITDNVIEDIFNKLIKKSNYKKRIRNTLSKTSKKWNSYNR